MLRIGLIVLACVVGLAVIAAQLFPSDRKRVEQEVERLADLARRGGPDAAEEILALLADDYRGPIPRRDIEKQVRARLEESGVGSLRLGDFKTVWKGDREILIPILALRADGWPGPVILTVTFADRDGRWRITSCGRTRWGR